MKLVKSVILVSMAMLNVYFNSKLSRSNCEVACNMLQKTSGRWHRKHLPDVFCNTSMFLELRIKPSFPFSLGCSSPSPLYVYGRLWV